jgi:hypothetical protein
VRLGQRGQICFNHRGGRVFDGRRLVRVDFEPQSLVLPFAAVEAIPSGLVEGDCFRLTRQGKETNGMSLAAKSLLSHLGFRANGA